MEDLEETIRQSLPELRARWRRSRESALRRFFPMEKGEEGESLKHLGRLSEENFESLLKDIFQNSRSLGRSYQKAFGLSWERSDFAKHLSDLNAACAAGVISESANAISWERRGCPGGKAHGFRYCQYWREAFDGVVLGLSDTERYVRHKSLGCGDSYCVDLIYADETAPNQVRWRDKNMWGTIPPKYAGDLSAIEEKLIRFGAKVDLLGIKERVLFYKFEPGEKQMCGGGGAILKNLFEKMVKDKFPGLSLRDATPLPIHGGAL